MRCLIVDDSADFVDAARGLFECHGITVVDVASTSAEALRCFEELRPDVTLVDLGHSMITNTRHVTGNPPYSFVPYSSAMSAAE
jgi:CheY-like chemotaxis protein